MVKKLSWVLTPWQISPKGKWVGEPPWLIIDGRIPFKSMIPEDYIKELEKMAKDENLKPGIFYTLIGQLKDALRNLK
jgi:hypothetical protein